MISIFFNSLVSFISKIIVKFKFIRNNVKFHNDFISRGIPFIRVYKDGDFKIGSNFKINNGFSANIIGRQQKCIFVVKGSLKIGHNVGLSSVAIVCHNSISIGNNVLIGGNTVIYDTDFHSLDFKERISNPEILINVKTNPVYIGENVFVGGHSTILKGVSIGRNSIIGAGSVVTKNVPENEIWAGNPAKKVRNINPNY